MSSNDDILQKAKDLIKQDVQDMFATGGNVDKDKEAEAKAKAEAEAEAEAEAKAKEASEKEAAEKAEKEADAKLSDEERAAKEAKKVAEAKVEAEAEAKEKAEKEVAEKAAAEEGAKSDEEKALAALEAQNVALLDQVETLAGQVLSGVADTSGATDDGTAKKVATEKAEAEAAAAAKAVAEKEGKKAEPVEFVTEENFEDALSSSKNLNTLLARVADTAASEGERRGYERAIRETPALVDKITDRTVSLREAVRDFLDENKDLVPLRRFVGVEVNRLRAENPEWPIDKLFNEAGDSVREKVKLSKVAKDIDDQTVTEDPAAFVKRGARGRVDSTKDKLSPLQKEIGELVEFAEGK